MSGATAPQTVAAELKAAAEPYVEDFRTFSGKGAAAVPGWLRERRSAAMTRFADTGFPTSRQEEWRFTDVKPIARRTFHRAAAASAPDVAVRDYVVGGTDQWLAVFVNGHFVPTLSDLGGLPAGVKVGSLRHALDADGSIIEPHLARRAVAAHNPFAALNTAFILDGGFLYVPRGTALPRTVHYLFLAAPSGDGAPLVTHPRNLFVLEQGAQASVIESYAAVPSAAEYWTNAVTEVVVGENATLDTYRVQREGAEAYHTATTHAVQGRSSNCSLITFSFGGALSRHDIHAVLDGEGADATLDGLSMLRGKQHVDYHTTLEHAQPNCTSWEYFNGVFDERSRGIFNGRIIVRPGAQKTDAKQTNNNLLLSEHARADSQPQLEIYADDVKCTHGATLGPIDDEHLFYLQSRGLSTDEARALLTYGFGSEILHAVKAADVRRSLDRIVHDWLTRRTPAGA
jgi:Fe-S cluster assembly protein SufD